MLEGWRDAVPGGRYAGVRYDCASASAASSIGRLAKKVWLTPPDLSVTVQSTAEEIAALARADAEAEGQSAAEPETTGDGARIPSGKVSVAPADVRISAAPVPVPKANAQRPAPRPQTPEEAAERERRYREIFGIAEPKRRRRWRRRAKEPPSEANTGSVGAPAPGLAFVLARAFGAYGVRLAPYIPRAAARAVLSARS